MNDARPAGGVPGLLRSPLAAFFFVGLVVRLAGMFFNGVGDLNQILLDWGFAVHRHGLVEALGINYGVLSYALFGRAAAAA